MNTDEPSQDNLDMVARILAEPDVPEEPAPVPPQSEPPKQPEDIDAVKRLEATIAEAKAIVERGERLRAMDAVGGRSEASQAPPPVKTKDELLTDEINEWLAPTGRRI